MRNVLVNKLFALFFLLIFLALQLGKVIIVADYYTNTNKYAKNCINKARPQLHCNGKCQMMKKIREQEKKEKEEAEKKSENKIDKIICQFTFSEAHEYFVINDNSPKKHILENNIKLTRFEKSVFHPPRQSA